MDNFEILQKHFPLGLEAIKKAPDTRGLTPQGFVKYINRLSPLSIQSFFHESGMLKTIKLDQYLKHCKAICLLSNPSQQ